MAISDVKKEMDTQKRINDLELFYKKKQDKIENDVKDILNRMIRMENVTEAIVQATRDIISEISKGTFSVSVTKDSSHIKNSTKNIDPSTSFIPSINTDSFKIKESPISGDSTESISNFINIMDKQEEEMHKAEEAELDNGKLCDYGCGKVARYVLYNGKNCCEPHYTKCPAVRDKMVKAKVKTQDE